MKRVIVHQVDAFTNKIFGGNPAGVVVDANHLTDEDMQNIAREMNLSETAFLLKPTKKDADIKIRYFTSGKDEVDFCGHATIASLYEIGRLGLLGTQKKGKHQFLVETNVGILSMIVIKKSVTNIAVQFTPPEVNLIPYHQSREIFAKRFGIPLITIDPRYPIMLEKNLTDIHLVITSLKTLGELDFDFQRIKDSFKQEKIVVFSLFTPETFHEMNDIHVRGLAPLVGVPEDPFTGRLQGAIATYAMLHNLLPKTKTIRTEQGHFIGRPGFAQTTLPTQKENAIIVSGNAVHVFTGEINLS